MKLKIFCYYLMATFVAVSKIWKALPRSFQIWTSIHSSMGLQSIIPTLNMMILWRSPLLASWNGLQEEHKVQVDCWGDLLYHVIQSRREKREERKAETGIRGGSCPNLTDPQRMYVCPVHARHCITILKHSSHQNKQPLHGYCIKMNAKFRDWYDFLHSWHRKLLKNKLHYAFLVPSIQLTNLQLAPSWNPYLFQYPYSLAEYCDQHHE